ncbi:MAG: hypoxanthine phosphoribosyltransferase [Spirochaetia bacterium]|nr:hypoxanthine phosphoribosyltransferase [Spirochaetia bacterium]
MEIHLKSLISRGKIRKRIEELGQKITEDFNSRDLLIVAPLKGSFVFCSDLVRSISLPLRIDFMELSSYSDGSVSSGKVKIIKDLTHDIRRKHVLLVEDILDTGLTVATALNILSSRNPESISLVVFLDKKKTEIVPEYTGFEIDDEFVVGYGMDYRGYYRNLEYVGVLDQKNKDSTDSMLDRRKV